MVFSSCETTDLDITEDPNALSDAQSSTDLFVNSIQRDFGRLIAEIEDEASEVPGSPRGFRAWGRLVPVPLIFPSA